MGVRQYSTYSTADTTLVTTAETVIATLSGVSMNKPGQTVGLRGTFTITTGGSTTAVTTRVREDSLTGTIVGEALADSVESAAGGTETHDIYCEHAPSGEIAGKTYVLTAQQTAAAANGSVLSASLVAEVKPL